MFATPESIGGLLRVTREGAWVNPSARASTMYSSTSRSSKGIPAFSSSGRTVLRFSRRCLRLYGHGRLRSILKAKDEPLFALACPFEYGNLLYRTKENALVEGSQKIVLTQFAHKSFQLPAAAGLFGDCCLCPDYSAFQRLIQELVIVGVAITAFSIGVWKRSYSK